MLDIVEQQPYNSTLDNKRKNGHNDNSLLSELISTAANYSAGLGIIARSYRIYHEWKKNFYDQGTDSDIKKYEEIRKLRTGQVEDYTTGCLLNYEYIKNHYKLIAIDLSSQK